MKLATAKIATYAVIGRTDPRIRLRHSSGSDLGLAVGDGVLVDAEHETLLAYVIGLPAIGVVEIETRGSLDGKPKALTLRPAPLAARRAA